MRLGAQQISLEEGSLAATSYGATSIEERHRHRYEVNNNSGFLQASFTRSSRRTHVTVIRCLPVSLLQRASTVKIHCQRLPKHEVMRL